MTFFSATCAAAVIMWLEHSSSEKLVVHAKRPVADSFIASSCQKSLCEFFDSEKPCPDELIHVTPLCSDSQV